MRTLLLVFSLALILGSCKTEAEKFKKPNVILVITDDQGYGDLGAHGNPYIQTPAMDQLHRESVRFTNFHVSPTCSPTRAALMTGRFTNRTGAWHTIAGWSMMRANEKTLANMFSEGGYRTAAFGKWHLGDNYPYRVEDRGFDESVVHGGGGVLQTPDYWGNDYFNDSYFKNGKAQAYQGYCTDIFFDEAINFIEKESDQAFFCYLATNAPHGPFNVPLDYLNKYEQYPDSVLLPHQKRFMGMITNIDDNIARLRQKLEELEIADNTLFIFMTDNGTAGGISNREGKSYGFNANMRGIKGSEYEGGHRVPLFMYWKDGEIYGGKDINQLSAHVDLMPTLAELCQIQLPDGHLALDGKSLTPLLKSENPLWEDRFLITDSQRDQVPVKFKKSAVMSQKWRLINGKELYDIETDPSQKEDLASTNPDQVTAMREAYDTWWESMVDSFDDEMPFQIGSPAENPMILTCHDWHTQSPNVPWNQFHIRKGEKGQDTSFYWTIEVLEAGTYEFDLSRYPFSSGLALNAAAKGVTMEEEPGIDRDTPPGTVLSFEKAWIKMGDDIRQEANIKEDDIQASFSLSLEKGLQKLSAGFVDKQGQALGAYYLRIKKI